MEKYICYNMLYTTKQHNDVCEGVSFTHDILFVQVIFWMVDFVDMCDTTSWGKDTDFKTAMSTLK